jgi:thiamine-phosphate pyrophosphorylase
VTEPRLSAISPPTIVPGPPAPRRFNPTLYAVLDRAAAEGRDLADLLAAVIDGGCRMVQLREKTWESGRILPVAERLRARCRESGVTFIVNDRVDLALAVDADGIHLGQDDLPARVARPLLRPGMILGISIHSLEQARAARDAGADYVAVGSMFPTATKSGFQLVGPALIRAVRPEISVPLVGIGGITPDNVGEVMRAGADGVAVVSAISAAPDPRVVTTRFLRAIAAAGVD